MLSRPTSSRRGSAILMVAIVAAALGLLLGSVALRTTTEKRLNHRQLVFQQARIGAEAVLEQGVGQLVSFFQNNTQFTALSLVDFPLAQPPSAFWPPPTGGVAVTATVDGQTKTVSSFFDRTRGMSPAGKPNFLMGGVIGDLTFGQVNDPDSPFNNQFAFSRNVRLLARASAADPGRGGRTVTSHVTQTFWLIDAPLFASAIFYNMDLEIANSPPLDIGGTVISNGDLFHSGGGGSITARNGMFAAGEIFYGRSPVRLGANQGNTLASVQISNRANNNALVSWPSDLNRSSAPAKGSLTNAQYEQLLLTTNPPLSANWLNSADQLWGGGVRSASHGMQNLDLVGMREYQAPVGSQPLVNDAISLIQPPAPLLATDPEYATKASVEAQKFSNKAGLYIRHEMTLANNIATHTVRGFRIQRDGTGAPVRDAAGQVQMTEVDLPPGLWNVQRNGDSSSSTPSTPGTVGMEYSMRDWRRGQDLRVLDLDVSVLKAAVENSPSAQVNGSFPANRFPDNGGRTFDPASHWNGVVYVETVNAATIPSGVRLLNGSVLPSRGTDAGLTVATNNALYVQGHYNADGKDSTGTIELPDHRTAGWVGPAREFPAALVADAVNFVSSGFDAAKSFPHMGDWDGDGGIDGDDGRNPQPGFAADVAAGATNNFLEISAAVLAGIVPSNLANYSGGVENFPRFLENLGGSRTMRYRGSMVVLFQSAIATQPWGGGYYSPPARRWGFNRMFSEGSYPPGTPFTRAFSRYDFRDLNEAEFTTVYNDMKAQLVARGANPANIPSPF